VRVGFSLGVLAVALLFVIAGAVLTTVSGSWVAGGLAVGFDAVAGALCGGILLGAIRAERENR
jgi:hypothetical protein